eukprot:GHUV01055503.1.p1 GENE.GHUV01055503.1~~GHUV01055503.1.p1  ORF type:complete len:458 (+),score=146.03 GHUV01055503.1:348-1721(+)
MLSSCSLDLDTQQNPPAMFGAGLQFMKQHGSVKQQLQQHGRTQGRTDQGHQHQPHQSCPAAQEAQQLQTSPLYQQVQLQKGRALPQQRSPQGQPPHHQNLAASTPLVHDASNKQDVCGRWQLDGSGVVTNTDIHPLQQASTALQQPQQPQHSQTGKQLPGTTTGQTCTTKAQRAGGVPQHRLLHHECQHQQQASQQGHSYEDLDIDDSVLAAADAYCSQHLRTRAHAREPGPLLHAAGEHLTRQATPALGHHLHYQQQAAWPQVGPGSIPAPGQQLSHTTTPVVAVGPWQTPGGYGVQSSATHQQYKHHTAAAGQPHQERQQQSPSTGQQTPHAGNNQQWQGQAWLQPGVSNSQQQPVDGSLLAVQAGSCLQPRQTLQQQLFAAGTPTAGPNRQQLRNIAASDAGSLVTLPQSTTCDRGTGHAQCSAQLEPAAMQQVERDSTQQQAWRGFAQQQRQQ